MKVRVRFYAHCREISGRDRLEVDLPEGATGSALWKILEEKFPRFKELSPIVALAVNEEYVRQSVQLKDGDEVSLIPPVSGG